MRRSATADCYLAPHARSNFLARDAPPRPSLSHSRAAPLLALALALALVLVLALGAGRGRGRVGVGRGLAASHVRLS